MTVRSRWFVCSLFVAALAGCGAGTERCRPGDTRTCALDLEGGFTQAGTQSCGGDHAWAECLGAGACQTATGTPVAPYARCAVQDDCGPASCAACTGYSSVQNPTGATLCAPFCATDADCAPASATTGVAARCSLGQCIVLCHTGDVCPEASQCLPWSDPASGADFPGFDGLCD